ncbi:hypothetical protein VKT23_011617 [Stygiomarasmius scandens]|uniref:Uncharacterized protein n=1 Tax=Marasmiellus scandens TaxID=2682957 RepID=A0ABR1JDE3_9AGAR
MKLFFQQKSGINQIGRKYDEESGSTRVPFTTGRELPKWVIALLAFSVISGIFCIAVGSLIRMRLFSLGGQLLAIYDPNFNISFRVPPLAREILKLLFNVVFVKPCVSVFNRVHGTAMKWQIACESDPQRERFPRGDPRYQPNTRLEFNANPRFLMSSHSSRLGPTGLPANVLMIVSLAITYAASQMVLLELEDIDEASARNTVLSHFSLHVLGTVILIQALISIWALVSTDIKTWNQSPFATAYILSHELGRLRRTPGRCMQSLYHRFRDSQGSVKAGSNQMSAWDSHPIFRALTMRIWMLVGSGLYWGLLMYAIIQSGTPGTFRGTSWLPISEPSNATSSDGTSVFYVGWDGIAPSYGLLWGLAVVVGFQGGIVTTAMTCAQTILDLVCDQRLWMEIQNGGSDPTPHIFKKFMICWHSYLIHFADPLFHWLFGLAANISADRGLQIRPVPVFWVTAAGVLGASYITYFLKRKIKTPLPTTFGHLQTMVDLVDEWHERMYWGDKSIGYQCGHAGTSNTKYRVVGIIQSKSYGGQKCIFCHNGRT